MGLAFVTGAAGFIGTNLVERLAAEGWRVVALYRPNAPPLHPFGPPNVELVAGDITSRQSLARAMPEGVDAVFHVAANTSFWSVRNRQQYRDNVEGTRNVVDVALERRARRLVHTSSIGAFGIHPDRVTEETPSNAEDVPIHYFRTKRLAELEVEEGVRRGLDAVIVNPANVIGPHDSKGWVQVFTLVHQGKVHAISRGVGSFCHVGEVARAHLAAFEKGATGERYLLGGSDASFEDLMYCVGRRLERRVTQRTAPYWLLRAVGWASLGFSYLNRREPQVTPEKALLASSRIVCSSAKAERELGYRPVPLAVMLDDCYRWLVSKGVLESHGSGGSEAAAVAPADSTGE